MRDIFVIIAVALTTAFGAEVMRQSDCPQRGRIRRWLLEFLGFWFCIATLYAGVWIIAIVAGGHQ